MSNMVLHQTVLHCVFHICHSKHEQLPYITDQAVSVEVYGL